MSFMGWLTIMVLGVCLMICISFLIAKGMDRLP